jgi:hypothetical protein
MEKGSVLGDEEGPKREYPRLARRRGPTESETPEARARRLGRIEPHRFPGGEANPQSPANRAKRRTNLKGILERLLEEPSPRDGLKNGELTMLVALRKAQQGSFPHFKEIMDRVHGKVPDRLIGDEAADDRMVVIREVIARTYGLLPPEPGPGPTVIDVTPADPLPGLEIEPTDDEGEEPE